VALAPIDRATLAYLALALGFTLVHGPRARPAALLLPLGLLLAAALAGYVTPRARHAGPLARVLAEFYPLLLTPALYTHVGLVNLARGVSHDERVQAWEQALFGSQPSLDWIRAFPSPGFSLLMHAAYVSYYAILVAFPVAGPRYLFPPADNEATAIGLAVLTNRLLEAGSAWGTAFPSSHVAAGLVAAFCAWRALRPLGAVLLPVSILLWLGTVYGQFHYAVDALAGAVVAALVLWLGRWAGYDAGSDLRHAAFTPGALR
jgi:membrane-associated phospholipid phosphatase